MPPNQPADLVRLAWFPDDAFGQAWHMPCAPTRTPRQILELGARALGAVPRISTLPHWLQATMGTVSPLMRELTEMRFLWSCPYHVDARKFTDRFWSDVTPFDIGAAETALSFRDRATAMAA